jgi:hypothetical protein
MNKHAIQYFMGSDRQVSIAAKVIQRLPALCTLTGLRASECINSIRLVKYPEQMKTYYNEGRQTLEHFRSLLSS